jgi:hypothetical protein
MIPRIILFAFIAGFSTLFIRVIISHRPFLVRNIWHQIVAATVAGGVLWVAAIFLTSPGLPRADIKWEDILCGMLILLCAFWCNYWSTNLAGGFRIQMQMNLAAQSKPLSLKEWMTTFGGLGMDVFLKDRIESVLIPYKTVVLETGNLRLLPGWGMFFSKLMILLRALFPNVRAE